MNLQILVLVLAIVLFGVLAFKQMSALILAPLVTIFVVICSRLPILDSLKNAFIPAASDYVTVRLRLSIYRSRRIHSQSDRRALPRKIRGTDHHDHHRSFDLWRSQWLRCIFCYLSNRIKLIQGSESYKKAHPGRNLCRMLDVVHERSRFSFYSECHCHG